MSEDQFGNTGPFLGIISVKKAVYKHFLENLKRINTATPSKDRGIRPLKLSYEWFPNQIEKLDFREII